MKRVIPFVIVLAASLPAFAHDLRCSDLRGDHDSRARYENHIIMRQLNRESRHNLDGSQLREMTQDVRRYCDDHGSKSLDEATRDVWRHR